MKRIDRVLQRWRIRKVIPFLGPGMRVLDVGCDDGILRKLAPALGEYLGIDPNADGGGLIRGNFPRDLPEHPPFDAVVVLAVLEHVPIDQLPEFVDGISNRLAPGGLALLTVPSPAVDRILAILKALRLIEGMSLDQHHRFEVQRVEELFASPRFKLLKRARFQLGLNNLFVFRKTGD